ncbi:unnamed protein product [Bursaphelenchus okinawaensis]|uniref:Uncharacterized protein n=1 Tax=Bursaphelenchus okinawaensis TaxID=465554 RepID=A0A811LRT7_9BILA|nr:unnamed protein product [Bursaphelenchus okinawaensis]CAG9127237.1 unnamed protein product [Bursaphelenchus okinawaensis]
MAYNGLKDPGFGHRTLRHKTQYSRYYVQSTSTAPSEVESKPTNRNNNNNLLKWHRDLPSPSFSVQLNRIKEEYYPLNYPMHLTQFSHKTEVKFDHTIDYLITWRDTHDCCGMVKSKDDLGDGVPIVIRFGGHWSEKDVRRLYIGFTVRVKSMYRVGAVGNCRKEADIVSSKNCINDIMFSAIPFPTAIACEWAVVHKPKIVRTLGMVLEDYTWENKNGLVLAGLVQDSKFNNKVMVCHERWPVPQMKKIPEFGRAVVINYVELNEPHTVYQCRDKGLLMPDYMSGVSVNANYHGESHHFVWIDLTFEPRRFDDC